MFWCKCSKTHVPRSDYGGHVDGSKFDFSTFQDFMSIQWPEEYLFIPSCFSFKYTFNDRIPSNGQLFSEKFKFLIILGNLVVNSVVRRGK